MAVVAWEPGHAPLAQAAVCHWAVEEGLYSGWVMYEQTAGRSIWQVRVAVLYFGWVMYKQTAGRSVWQVRVAVLLFLGQTRSQGKRTRRRHRTNFRQHRHQSRPQMIRC
jgi:hypothetical protein